MKVGSRMSENASIFSFLYIGHHIGGFLGEGGPLRTFAFYASGRRRKIHFVRLYAKKVGRAFQGKCVGISNSVANFTILFWMKFF